MLHGTAGGIKGKIGWRDTVSRRGLKKYVLSIRFLNILKVICHGKYITIIKIGERERKKKTMEKLSKQQLWLEWAGGFRSIKVTNPLNKWWAYLVSCINTPTFSPCFFHP